MLEKDYDPRRKEFLNKYAEDKIPSIDIQTWFKDNKGLPPRTFQWYVREELLFSPKLIEGRHHFYTKDEFCLLVDMINVIQGLKESTLIRFSMLKKVFGKYKNLRALVDQLLELTEKWPLYKPDQGGDEPYYNNINDRVWKVAIERLGKGVDLDTFKIIDIEAEVIEKMPIKQ